MKGTPMKGFIDESKIETRLFINGEYVPSKNGKTIIKTSSFTGEKLVPVYAGEKEDADNAVKAALNAYKTGIWSGMSLAERKAVILKFADLMEENRDILARLDTYETCRAYRNYYYDSIPKAIEAVRYFAEAADKLYDTAIPPKKDSFGIVCRKPLGVVAVITPWNDPMVVMSWKSVPALLMGNSVIIKPAEQSSLSALFTASLAKKAGIPDGVYNVVPGYGEEAGKALALNNDVSGVFFTGSSAVGKQIIIYSGMSNMKKVGLECGGKGPFIVTAGCKDIKKAAEVLAANMFYNQGQICSAPSRVIIDRSIRDTFLEYLIEESRKFVPGNPFDIKNNVGCVVSGEQYDRVMSYIEMGKNEAEGYFAPEMSPDMPDTAKAICPHIFYGVSNKARIAREEIFGPVSTVIDSVSTEEAVAIANDSEYGLAGAVFTDDISEAYYVADHLECGLIHVNSYGEDDNTSPFGGIKQSGIGKDKSLFAFDEYSQLRSVWVKTAK